MTYDPYQQHPEPYVPPASVPPTQQFSAPPHPPPYPPQQAWQQPPPPGYGPPPGYPYQQPPAPLKKNTTLKAVLVGAAAIFAVCVGMAVLGSVNDPPAEPKAAPAAAAPIPTVTTARAGTPPPLSPVEDPKPVAMPDVRGQNAAVARDYLTKLGFTNITFGSQDELDTWVVLPENWTVKKQSTKTGRKIPTDTLIVLTCTKTG